MIYFWAKVPTYLIHFLHNKNKNKNKWELTFDCALGARSCESDMRMNLTFTNYVCICQCEFFRLNCFVYWKYRIETPFSRTSNDFRFVLNNIPIIVTRFCWSSIFHSSLYLFWMKKWPLIFASHAIRLTSGCKHHMVPFTDFLVVFVIYVPLQCFHNTFDSS